MDQNKNTQHVVFIPTPGMGHLIPLIELAKRILQSHSFTVSFIIPSLSPPTREQKSVLGALPKEKANYHFLPLVNLDDLPTDAKIETRIALTLARSIPDIRGLITEIQSTCHFQLTALVVDLFGTDAFDVAREFNMKPYLFFPSNALFLSLCFHLHKLDVEISSEYRDMAEPLRMPGCVPVQGKDLVDPLQDRKNDAYKWCLHHFNRYKLAEGILVNSFMELEEETFNVLKNSNPGFPPVYPVGPLVRVEGEGEDRVDECVTWLNDQPRGSVLFVSFGSGGTLSYDQLIELAHGLEMSEQRFLWVVRPPNNKSVSAAYFNSESDLNDPLYFLPEELLERIKGRGLIVRDWAPQVNVLSHESTGGFLTHCGWNSTLESVVNGVPFIAWPLFAEQRMNAVMLTEGLKVALRPEVREDGLVGQMEIATAVKCLMEGEGCKEIRNKMKELKDTSSRVLSSEGSSTKALSEVVVKWTSN